MTLEQYSAELKMLRETLESLPYTDHGDLLRTKLVARLNQIQDDLEAMYKEHNPERYKKWAALRAVGVETFFPEVE